MRRALRLPAQVWNGTGHPADGLYRRARIAAMAAQMGRERVLPARARKYGDVPGTPQDVTDEWLTAVLCRDVPGAEVTSSTTTVHSAGSSTRWHITVQYNAAGQAAGLPPTVFAKTTAAYKQRMMLGFIGNLVGEPTFFREFRPKVEIEAPIGYYGAADGASWRSISLIEDLVATKQAEFLTAQHYVTKDEMADLLATMAQWHGRFWDAPEVNSLVNDPASYVERAGSFFGWAKIAELGTQRAGAVIEPELARRTPGLLEDMLAGLRSVSSGPRTLLHGDPHIGNTYRTGAGRMGFTDWQCIVRGSWEYDFCYLVAGGLTIEDRRAWERDLLAGYLDRLAAAGGKPPTEEEAWRKYRAQTLWPYYAWLSTIGHGALQPNMQPDEISIEMVSRTATAVLDHDPVPLLHG